MAEAPAHVLPGLPRWYFLLMYGPRAAWLDCYFQLHIAASSAPSRVLCVARVLRRSSPFSHPYSLYCLEGKFLESSRKCCKHHSFA